MVNVVDGMLRTGDRIESAATGECAEVLEVGLLAPEPMPLRGGALKAGMVGYIITSSRSLTTARVGDTLRHASSTAPALPGFKAAKAMIFQGLFPATAEDYEALKAAVERLAVNDSSVSLSPSSSMALGPGFNAGFLGLLHAGAWVARARARSASRVHQR